MSPRIPPCWCEDTSAFSAQDRHECLYIQGTLPFSRDRLDMAPMVRESSESGVWTHLEVLGEKWMEKLPPFIEVRSPIIDTRLKIDIPERADYSFFCHDNLIALCTEDVKHSPRLGRHHQGAARSRCAHGTGLAL
jgi:hypothetical protein